MQIGLHSQSSPVSAEHTLIQPTLSHLHVHSFDSIVFQSIGKYHLMDEVAVLVQKQAGTIIMETVLTIFLS